MKLGVLSGFLRSDEADNEPLPSRSKFGTKSGGLKGIRSLPDGDLAGGGAGLLPTCEIPPSELLPLRVGLSAKGFAYSGGRGGVKKDRMGGMYEGSSRGTGVVKEGGNNALGGVNGETVVGCIGGAGGRDL